MKYQELRDALAAGPTPGPWSFKRHTSNLSGEHTKTDDWTIYGAIGNAICFEGNATELADPEYIAAANPDALRALLAERDALHSALQWMVQRADEGGYPDGKCLQEARAALSQGEQT